MSVDRNLTVRGHVDVDQIAVIIEEAGGGPVRTERMVPDIDMGVPLYFWFYFREIKDGQDAGANRRRGRRNGGDERMLRCYHGDQADSEGPFAGEAYTFISTGAYGCTDVVLKAIGQRFGGFYEDERTGEEIAFEEPTPPAP